MQAIRHILVPIDFGASAAEAVDFATELATKFDAELTLVHVYEFPLYAYASGIYFPTEDLHAAAKKATQEAVVRVRTRCPRTQGVIAEGVPWEQILSVATEKNVDLIVMGTHGRRGVARALLGSVAERVVRMAPMPVLTVHAHPKAAAA